MGKSHVEQCLSDIRLNRYIKYRASQVARIRPHTYDIDDASQELWLAIFKALPRYTGPEHLSDFASARVYSRYGQLIDSRRNHILDVYEKAYRDTVCNTPHFDKSFSLVEANLTLDHIEKILKEESKNGRQFNITLKFIQGKRKGLDIHTTAQSIGISVEYLRNAVSRVRKSKRLEVLKAC